MKRYPLQDLLEVRRRDEEAAAMAWAAARRRVDLAQAEAARIAARAAEARGHLQRAEQAAARPPQAHVMAPGMTPSLAPCSPPTTTGAALARGAQYLSRLREVAARAAAESEAFRAGPLATARADERRAAEGLTASRGAREASERHEAQFRADERRSEERREEEVRDDAARAVHHARPRRP